MFWSGDKLNSKCRDLVYYDTSDGQIDTKIDCASIVLTVGDECYVTDDGKKGLIRKILNLIKGATSKSSPYVIPKGQFGLILTREYVKVPRDAIAFISFKAKYKFLGLINVSGFHVDPGWDGKLVFSVYNAGPSDITLKRCDDFALIWYADLDETSSGKFVKKENKAQKSINSDIINNMSGDIFSPSSLKREIDEVKSNSKAAVAQARYWALITTLTIILGFFYFSIRNLDYVRDAVLDDQVFIEKLREHLVRSDDKN